MSTINLCDRCDAMVVQAALGSIDLRTDQSPNVVMSDEGYDPTGNNRERNYFREELCPACVEDIVKVLRDRPDRNGQAFRKSYPEIRRERANAAKVAALTAEASDPE